MLTELARAEPFTLSTWYVYPGTSWPPWILIPTAAAIGTPLYSSTELFVPIANSLYNAGVGIGAIVPLTIVGAARLRLPCAAPNTC